MDFWRDVKTKAATVAAAADLTVRKLEIQRKIGVQRAAQDRVFTSIGRAVAAQVKDGQPPPDGTQPLFAELDRIEDEIDALQDELANLEGAGAQKGMDLCPHCGAVVSADQRYCSGCGNRLGQ